MLGSTFFREYLFPDTPVTQWVTDYVASKLPILVDGGGGGGGFDQK